MRTISSNKRIPKSLVKKTEETISINDRYNGLSSGYVKNVAEEELRKVKMEIKEQEKQMLQEVEEKRDLYKNQAYQEGFEKAKIEVEEELRIERQQLMDEAQKVYEEANNYRKKILESAEEMKSAYIHEKKEELLALIVSVSEKLIHQEMEAHPEKLEHLLEEVLLSIQYENRKIFIRMNPKTREWFLQSKVFALDHRIELLPDATLGKIDIVIETEREYIDATIDTQIKQLKNALRSVIHD